MKENLFYLTVIAACGLLLAGSLTTDFRHSKPVYELWVGDLAVGNTTNFTLNIPGPVSGETIAIFVDDSLFRMQNVSLPATLLVSLPVSGQHKISVKLFDEKKSYNEFGSWAKPYEIFFRTG